MPIDESSPAGRHTFTGLMETTQQYTPAGWYSDPTGRHESRYYNEQWTQHVFTRGANSIDPLVASPVPAAGTPPHPQTVASTAQRSARVRLAIAGGVVAAAVGIPLAVASTGDGGTGGHGFCADAVSFAAQYRSISTETKGPDLSSWAADWAGKFDLLAAESPSAQNAADLRYVAHTMRYLATGNYAAFEAAKARANVAADRAGTYITDECG